MDELAGEKVREAVMTTGEKLIEQGRQEGLLHGERKLLLRLLTKRFGDLSAEVEQRVCAGQESDLTRWADRLLTAASVDEVFAVD